MPPFSRPDALRWLSTRRDHHDRAGWAIMRADDGAFFEEVPPDGCANGRSSPHGTCFGYPDLRRLDDSAWDDRLETLTESARAAELHTRLWCPEHGPMRASQITVNKICRLPGSTFH